MAVARKPFMTSQASAAGDTMQPGMPMPPQAGRTGPQPTMPMGGAPQGDPMQQLAPPPPAIAPNAGGPTSPLNIGQMLQARMGDRSAGPQAPMPGQGQGPSMSGAPGAPGAPDAGGPPTMQPWGDQGTRPNRVALGGDAMGADMGAGGDLMAAGQMPNGNGNGNGQMPPTVMMRLLRTLGQI